MKPWIDAVTNVPPMLGLDAASFESHHGVPKISAINIYLQIVEPSTYILITCNWINKKTPDLNILRKNNIKVKKKKKSP